MAGRITQNTDATITPGRPGDAATRNVLSRVFLANGEAFEVIVRTRADETVVAKGTAIAARGKLCSLYVKTRAEADVDKPRPRPMEEPG